jgi:hypothetical protein
LLRRKNIVPQSVFKLNNTLATTETWHLKGCMLQVKFMHDYKVIPHILQMMYGEIPHPTVE